MAQRSNLKPASGTARQDRFSKALDPASAPVDDRTYADLMSFALDFSKLVNFYDASNQPVADWQSFFKRDLSFLLAKIVTTDLQKDNHQGWALQNAVKAGRENTRDVLRAIYQLASRLDEWYGWALDIALKDRADNDLRATLQSIIERDVRQELQQVDAILEKLPSTNGRESWPDYWSRLVKRMRERSIWDVPAENNASAAELENNAPVDNLLAVLRSLHLATHNLQQVARQYLDESKRRTNHPPHTALYLAFSKLFLLLRDKINTLTDRHLDFYYREVLKLKERESSPDKAHVCFDLAPELTSFVLPAGSRLTAGKDQSGKPIEYTTDQSLTLNRAQVASRKALYLTQAHISIAPGDPDRVINIFALPEAASEDGKGEPMKTPQVGWPTFGINEATNESLDTSALHAELGFIVETPMLLLGEGERNVVVSVAFAGDGKLEAALESYQSVADRVLDSPASIETLLGDAFLVYVSGEKGWMPVANASFRRHPVVATAMEIEFTLRSIDPAVTANAAIAPAEENRWPLFKLVLNPHARVYAYQFFTGLEIETIEFRVNVSGAQKMQLRNELGLLDPAQPFPVFGPTPAVGSYLLVSHRELSVKPVDHATVTLNWFNLPKPPADLESYYAAYGLGTRDDSFKLRLSVFGLDKWQTPKDAPDVYPMFARDYDRSGGLLPVTVLAAQMPEIPLQASVPAMPPVLSDSDAPRGSLRLELAEPDYGFGQQVFPTVMAEIAVQNAKAGKNGPQKPLPNPPFAPVAKTLTLDYEAADKLVLTRPLPEERHADFYCLHPFGYLRHQGRATTMFPGFSEQGHLFLGISEARPRQPVTLLFQICDTAYSPVPKLHDHRDEEPLPMVWRYLRGDEWKPLPPALMLSDTTMGLTRSGIVTISLPGDITTESSLMPSGLCWIEAAEPKVAGTYWSRVVSIFTQAVCATRLCEPGSELVPAVLPANSIAQLSQKLPQIKAVRQPFATNNGRSRENVAEFRARVSERLRHKDRAVQAYDFERLILDNFPEVGQVKCVGNNNSRNFLGTIPVAAGTVYLVVTPRLEDTDAREPRLPQYVLTEIEHYIRKHVSAFVEDIHVINPVYETLKVFANVEFTLQGDGAGYIDELDKALSIHLQPWRSKPFKPMPIGSGQIQSYEVAQFIQQQQSYVARLHYLAMLHTFQTEHGFVSRWISGEKRAAGPGEPPAGAQGGSSPSAQRLTTSASAPWSVIVPAERHFIAAFSSTEGPKIDGGIRDLTVGSDLVLDPEADEGIKEDHRQLRYFLVVPAHREHENSRR